MDNQPNQNSELNQFLNNLDASLSGMSANRRSQELKEMRLHIEEIATQLEGNGLEPALALQNAVRQMGDPNSIGEKLTEEWRLTSDGRRRILIGGIVRAGVFGALASVFCSDIRSIFSNVAFFSHGHIIARASQFAIAEDLVVDLLTLCCLCAILISGAILASAIPRTSTPMSIIPAAIYASIIFDVTQTLLLPRFIPSFPWNSLLPLVPPVFNSQFYLSVSNGPAELLFLFLNSISRIAVILALSAYFFAVNRHKGFDKFDKSAWRLRID